MRELLDIAIWWVGAATLFLIALSIYESIYNWVEVKVRSLVSRLFAPAHTPQE